MSLRVLLLLVPLVALLACSTARSGSSGAPAPAAPRAAAATGNAPVLLREPADPTIAFRVSFAVGSQNDPAGKEGLAYLTGIMLAEGATTRHTYAEILQRLYPMAAGYTVRVDKERTTFAGRVHRDNLDAYTELLLDALLRPAFREDDFARLKQRTLDYLAKTLRYASDEELGKAALHNAVFAGTPYGHIVQGTVSGLEAITLEDVRAFYRERFSRGTALLGLGGGFDDALVTRLEKALAELPEGRPAGSPVIAPRRLSGREVVIVNKPGPATAISFGFPIQPRRGERDFYALWIANSWLGEHRNSASHLYQVIREARGLNYGDYSYIEVFPEGGMREFPPTGVPRRAQLFEVWVRPVPNEAAHFALRAAVREVEELVQGGMSQEELELTRAFLSKYVLHFAPTTEARLGYLIDDRFYGIEAPGHLARFREMIGEITREEVNAALTRHLDPKNIVIAMVSEQADALADALAAEAPSPISYETPKPADVLEEDKAIATYRLGIERGRVRVVPVEEMFAR